MFDSRKKGFESRVCYNAILTCPFGIHSSLDGIPTYRVVFLNSEAANTNGETITDNGSVGNSNTTGATTVAAGITIDGSSADAYSDLTFLPGVNQDLNVSVTILGTTALEVEAGEVVAVGEAIEVNTVGQAVAAGGTGTATGFVALSGATGAGTADNPEFIVALVK